MDTDNLNDKKTSGILETVMNSQAAEALRNFDPHAQVKSFLQKKYREHDESMRRKSKAGDVKSTEPDSFTVLFEKEIVCRDTRKHTDR